MAKNKKNVIEESAATLPPPGRRTKEAIEAAQRRLLQRPIRPEAKLIPDGDGVALGAPHNDPIGLAGMISDALGSCSSDSYARAIDWLSQAARQHQKPVSNTELNSAIAFMAAVAPKDEFEGAIALQMFMAHDLAMEMGRRAKQASMHSQMESYGNLAAKMSRTFVAHVEVLTKLRRGGEQVVRHIHVDNRGGQAIIAETVNTGGVSGKADGQSHAQGALGTAMLGYDAPGNGVPMPGSEGQEAVPVARRKGRRALG